MGRANPLNILEEVLIGRMLLGGVALYVFALVFAGLHTPGYQQSQQLISELGQVGAPYAGLWRTILLLEGALVLLLAQALQRAIGGSRSLLGPALVATIGAGLVLGGIFQCDPACAPVTFHGWMHILTSVPATLAALAGPFVLARRMGGDPEWKRYSPASRAFGWISVATILAAFAVFPRCGVPGVGQRIATLAQMAWLSMMAWALIREGERGWPPGPSGPRALWYIGWRRELLSFTGRCRNEYGGICGIRLFGARFCLVSDPHLIEQVFVKHASRVRKWDTGRQFAMILGKGLLTSHGELWRRQRSLIQPVFQPARLGDYTSAILGHTESLLASWPADGVIDLHEEMLRLSLKIASTTLFGADSSDVEGLIAETQHLLMKQFEDALSGVPIPPGLPTPRGLRIRRAVGDLDRIVLELIARRRKAPAARDFLGALLAAQGEDGAGMSDRQLRDECMTMLLAGHETTALVLTWTLWMIARHPETGRELREELHRLAGDAPLSAEILDRLELQENVLNESLRLYPPVWAIGRVNLEPIELGAYRIPAGTQIFLVPYLAHRSGDVFEAADEFRPRRWEDPAIRTIPRCAFMPFGSGPRKCVGMHFAWRESMLVLASLLRRYSFEEVAGERVDLQASVTLRPARGLRVRVKKVGPTF